MSASRAEPSQSLPRAAATQSMVGPASLARVARRFEEADLELNSIMLWHRGAVVAEHWRWPYRADLPHMLHSATKSFTGTAIGMAVDEGLIGLDDTVLDHLPGAIARPGSHLGTMTIESLLTQTSGHAWGLSGASDRSSSVSHVQRALNVAVPFPQGVHFAYSSATSYLLSAVLTAATGDTMQAFLAPRLFEPLGMSPVQWDVDGEGVNPGGNSLSLRTEDLLKLGVLHLQRGQWQGREVLSEDWVKRATRDAHGNGYGFHWWIAPDGESYFAAGKFGQGCFVFPRHGAVLALTGGMPDHAHARALAQKIVFEGVAEMFEESPQGAGTPRRGRASVDWPGALLPPLKSTRSPLAERVSGREYVCEANQAGIQTITITQGQDTAILEVTDGSGAHVVVNGMSEWEESHTTLPGGDLHHGYEPDSLRVVAGAEWAGERLLLMRWQFVESGFRDIASLTFEGDDIVHFDRGVTVNSGQTRMETVVGRAIS